MQAKIVRWSSNAPNAEVEALLHRPAFDAAAEAPLSRRSRDQRRELALNVPLAVAVNHEDGD